MACCLCTFTQNIQHPIEKKNADPEIHKAEHWGHHAHHWSWYTLLVTQIHRDPGCARQPADLLFAQTPQEPGSPHRARSRSPSRPHSGMATDTSTRLPVMVSALRGSFDARFRTRITI